MISFNYDICNNLISIMAPDYGSGTQTLAQFDYQAATISNSFSGLTLENMPSGQVAQLKHVYFPATQTGYKFSYSVYGMIYTVSMRKQMSIDGNGVISDGTEKGYVTFNYPTTASSLTDTPAFTQRTEYPAATSGGTAVYSYSLTSGSGTKVFTITRPDSSTVTLTRSDTAGTDFGLLTQTEIKTSGGTSMAKSVITYANDPGGSPQVQNVISYDDATPTANQTKVDFDFDSYGNVTNTREYGFQDSGQWKVRRRSRTVYKTDSAYINAYLRSIPIESNTYDAQLDTSDANDVMIAKTTYTIDDYSGGLGELEDYGGATPPGHLSGSGTSFTLRGNATGVTTFTDVGAGTSTTRYVKYDIFGNVVKAEVSCCNVQEMTYGESNGFALVETLTKGSSGGAQVATSTDYDFNTSLASVTTDPNGLETTVTTRDDAHRPTLITHPTGATSSAGYDDDNQSASESVSYDDGGTFRTVGGSTVYDGLGRVIQQIDANNGQVNTAYDAMGRVISRTNPFAPGGSPGPSTTYSYDALGRVTVVTLPDSQTVQTTYNGPAVTGTDQVNRKIQRVSDGLGRLVTVNEQDVSTGSLNQATSYSYDYLDNLTQVNQGGQYRTFKYDSIGRLLFDRIPEQTATINDGSGTYWTSKYTYTTFDSLSTRTDARGVVTTYSYDSLNRVTQVNYNTVSGVTTSPTVTYTYDTDSTYSESGDGLLLRVNIGSDYQERYVIDNTTFRVTSIIRTIGSQTYTTGRSYNQASQLKQLTYPSTRAVNIGYDSKGRLNSLVSPPGNGNVTYLSSATYNVAGLVTGDTLGNGVTELFGYDANRMQLTSQKAGTASPYTNRMDVTYSYAATSGQMGSGSTAGNGAHLISVSGTINATTESAAYTYDNLGRLVTSNQTSNGSSAQRRFAYDRWGNRTGMWDATSGGTQIQSITLAGSGGIPNNQIESVTAPEKDPFSYTYDSAGNNTYNGVTEDNYTYDSENRLVSVNSGSTASYAYDHLNRRYKKTVGSTVTHYVWEGSQVMAEHNGGTGAVLIEYVHFGGKMIAKVASGTTQYILSDRLSSRMVLDANGNAIGRQGHLPFGDEFGGSGTQEKHHFTNYESDSETGTDYALNRQYSQEVGRFDRPDPLSSSGKRDTPQSWNRYAYSMSDPINMKDPLGLFACWDCGGPENPCSGPVPLFEGEVDWAFGSLLCMPLPAQPIPALDPNPSGDQNVQSCVIKVVVRKLLGALGDAGFHHLFIVLWDTTTNRTDYFGAFPSGGGGSSGGGSGDDGGLLKGRAGLFDANTAGPDFTATPVATWSWQFFDTCDELFDYWKGLTDRINEKDIAYNGPDGPNSNSFAFTLLKKGGFSNLIGQVQSWAAAHEVPVPTFPVGSFNMKSPIPGWRQNLL